MGGIVTSVDCGYRDLRSPGSSQTQTADDACSIYAGSHLGSRGAASAAYGVDGNMLIMELYVTAQGTFEGNPMGPNFSVGNANALAQITGLWLYAEQAATITFSATPWVTATGAPATDANALVLYSFGQTGLAGCNKHGCVGPSSGQVGVDPGEGVMMTASLTAVGNGGRDHGVGAAFGSLRLTASAWAADGSPVALLYSEAPLTFGAETIENPEPATYSVILLGLASLAVLARRRRGVSGS